MTGAPLTPGDLQAIERRQTGCTDGGCVFGHPGGMHTNGGCKCVPRGDHVHPDEAREVRDKVKALVADRRALLAHVRSLTERVETTEKERDQARRQRDTWAQRAGESERARLAAQVERDEARESVRSLTVERDALTRQVEERHEELSRVIPLLADRDDLRVRLSRAREALDRWIAFRATFRSTPEKFEGPLAALRAALAEPPGGP